MIGERRRVMIFIRLVSGAGDIKITKDGNTLLHEMVRSRICQWSKWTEIFLLFSKFNIQRLHWSLGQPQHKMISRVTEQPPSFFWLANFWSKPTFTSLRSEEKFTDAVDKSTLILLLRLGSPSSYSGRRFRIGQERSFIGLGKIESSHQYRSWFIDPNCSNLFTNKVVDGTCRCLDRCMYSVFYPLSSPFCSKKRWFFTTRRSSSMPS